MSKQRKKWKKNSLSLSTSARRCLLEKQKPKLEQINNKQTKKKQTTKLRTRQKKLCVRHRSQGGREIDTTLLRKKQNIKQQQMITNKQQ